jgi:hypothetical protein
MKKLALMVMVLMVVFLAANAGFAAPAVGHGGHHGGSYYGHGGHHGGHYGAHGIVRGYYGYYGGYGYVAGGPYIIGVPGIYIGAPIGPRVIIRAYPY